MKSARLKAKSPREAFYRLDLLKITDGYLIRQESGAGQRILHREIWFRDSIEEASRLYHKIIERKTDPHRRSPRKYTIGSETNLV